ncbi:MAG: hypothetical protein KDB94_02680 [Acidobacteria bacterium]|nr:hypothetical protein [Acidobacteriota bacterium]MCB9378586.1 hypothetical protein [Holophagales bacterium]
MAHPARARPRLGAALGVVASLALVGAATASGPSFDRLGPEQGLPHGTVGDLLQDRDGFLWLATSDGLARFDGAELRVFRFPPEEVARGASNRILALAEDRERRLWVATTTGIARLDRSQARLREEPSASAGESCRRSPLELDGDGVLWVGRNRVALRFDEGAGRFLEHPLPEGEEGWIADLARAPDGRVWALVTELDWSAPRLYRLGAERAALAPSIPIDGAERASRFAFDREGGLHVAGSQGGVRGVGVRFPSVAGLPDEPLEAYLEARDGRTWFGTSSGLFLAEPGAQSAQPVPLAGEPQDWQWRYVLSLEEDDAGLLWVGTLAGAFFHDPRGKPFRHLGYERGEAGGLPARAVSSVALAEDGSAWVGTYGGGLARVDLDRVRVIETFRHDPARPGSLCEDLIWSLLRDDEGGLWVGTESGLCHRGRGEERFRPVPLPLPGPPRSGIYRVKDLAAADGAIWVGTNLGLVRLEPNGGESRFWGGGGGPGGLSFAAVGTLLVDVAASGLYVGTTGGGLDRLDFASGTFAHYSTGGQQSRREREVTIYDLEPAAAGGLWIGSSDGLGRFLPDLGRTEFPAIRGELPGSTIFSVAEDATGELWLGTNRGLVRYRPATEELRAFDLGDGIGNLEFNRHAAVHTPGGGLAFGGMEGMTLFEPGSVRPSSFRPRTSLTRVAVLGTASERAVEPWGVERLVLGPEDRAVTFEWAVLLFSRSDRCASRYRLEGLDGEWIEAGTARGARYTNLEPGDYLFRVVSANADGFWSEDGAELAVRVLPPYWRSAWFRLLLISLAVGSLALAYRLRVARLRSLERMRLRIASDLHDELGGDLSGIAVAAGLVARREQLADADRDRLAGVQRTAVDVLHGLRDIVWCVDPSRDRLTDLSERLRGIARALFAETEMEVELELPNEPTILPMDLRRSLYLSAKELLHNVARHAGARRIRVALARREGRLRLEVEDDGVGFDPARVTEGTGLASVRRRMREAAGSVSIQSAPGEGAIVRLEVPFP